MSGAAGTAGGKGGGAGTSGGTAGSGASGAGGGSGGVGAQGGVGANAGGGTGGISGNAGDGSGGSAGTAGNAGSGNAGSGNAGNGGSAGDGGSAGSAGNAGSAGSSGGGSLEDNTVRVFYVKPTDVEFDQAYPDGIAAVVQEAQSYYLAELGRTFRLNDPIVEVVEGEHEASWYTNTPIGGDEYWYTVSNMQEELRRRFDLGAPDSRWRIVAVISAVGNGGGGSGWNLLTSHDADGAAGKRSEPMSRWYGGMIHEMGHMFGLPDSSSTDGTPMSASFYEYPNCHFSQQQKNAILSQDGEFFPQ